MESNSHSDTDLKQVNFFDGGHCTHVERMVLTTGRYCNTKFPSIFVHIEHPSKGHILYDTGYGQQFIDETKSFPFNIYAKMTPVHLSKNDTAVIKLQGIGVAPEDIKYIIISHFHGDHVAALKDFPNAEFIYLKEAYDCLKDLGDFMSLKNGFIPNLLPPDFESRSKVITISQEYTNTKKSYYQIFDKYYDLFGDESLIGVKLPGHAKGQLGLMFRFQAKKFFLIADSCWMSEGYEKLIEPAGISYLIADSKKEYLETLKKINELHKSTEFVIIPSHCGKKFVEYVKETHISLDKMNGL